MKEKIMIDGENAVLGRLASYVAKQALRGKEIVIVNCGKVLITGNKKNTEKEYKVKRARRSDKQAGPNFPSKPEQIVKRTIRGMLSYKQTRGREALKRIKCFSGDNIEGKKIKAGREKQGEYIKLSTLGKRIGK